MDGARQPKRHEMKIPALFFLAALGFFGAGTLGTLANEHTQQRTPVGLWEPPNGENRWEITTCGDPGAICAKLVWIRPDLRKKRNKKYIGQFLFNELPLVGDYKWRGPVTIEGNTVTGTLTQREDDVIVVRACILVLCADTNIVRVAPEAEEATLEN
jgi:uncharacterized protein (DUF2147 family)